VSTLTVYSSTADGQVRGDNANYATARSTGSVAGDTSATGYLGQVWTGAVFRCYQLFFSFDTSEIPSGATVSSATFSLYGSTDVSDTDFIMEVSAYDWGVAVTTADYIAGASLPSSYLASYATGQAYPNNWAEGAYHAFTSESTFPAAIVKGGTTYLRVYSNRLRGGNQPSGNEYVQTFMADDASTRDPRLVVEYTSPFTGITVIRDVHV